MVNVAGVVAAYSDFWSNIKVRRRRPSTPALMFNPQIYHTSHSRLARSPLSLSWQFRKGWAQPPFSRAEVMPLLERAAEIVVLIRADLDKHDKSFKMRMMDGR
jgi:hypothetical protein